MADPWPFAARLDVTARGSGLDSPLCQADKLSGVFDTRPVKDGAAAKPDPKAKVDPKAKPAPKAAADTKRAELAGPPAPAQRRADALREPAARLGIEDADRAIAEPAVKEQLRRNTEAAIAAGVFGVPTLAIADELFWGNDAHPLMAAVLADPGLLLQPEWQRLASLPVAVQRNR
ncbi:hypothetical protein G6F50_013103 [Rhizopus delemar]|uniref:DSBA-like thioredoxin domain-containing protein n=1 Tax=Rhizopus delemar TaxID=936053 RepID=A0A9P6YMP4_9FUNG|nr:hypothetical protein G6F50_013103 [Rhizopus delemar]